MADENESNKPSPSTLISDHHDVKQPSSEIILPQQTASKYMATLTANLLRVIAGAGSREQIMTDLHGAFTAYVKYVASSPLAGQPVSDYAMLSQLFLHTHFKDSLPETPRPETEQEWDRWVAEGDAPERDYEREHEAILFRLRLSVIRELAAAIAGIGAQRNKHKNDIESALDAELRAREALQQEQRERRNPSRKKAAQMGAERLERLHIRERTEATKREKQDQNNIEHLESHHVGTLRAVATKNLDAAESFLLDVLGRMRLISRPKGVKTKSAWELTELGQRALEFHDIKPAERKPP